MNSKRCIFSLIASTRIFQIIFFQSYFLRDALVILFLIELLIHSLLLRMDILAIFGALDVIPKLFLIQMQGFLAFIQSFLPEADADSNKDQGNDEYGENEGYLNGQCRAKFELVRHYYICIIYQLSSLYKEKGSLPQEEAVLINALRFIMNPLEQLAFRIFQMNRTPDSREILTYFSEFLNEIGLIMASIKKHMYTLIDVPMLNPKINAVFDSMSSIAFSTHRTYSDLKKIEAVIAGYLKSRTLAKKQVSSSLNSTRVTQIRSKSEEKYFQMFQDKKWSPICRSRNRHAQGALFMRSNIKTRPKFNESTELIQEQDIKQSPQFHYSFNKTPQLLASKNDIQTKLDQVPNSLLHNPCFDDLPNIQSRIKEMMSKNRKMFIAFYHRNQQCLQILNQAKQQLMINV